MPGADVKGQVNESAHVHVAELERIKSNALPLAGDVLASVKTMRDDADFIRDTVSKCDDIGQDSQGGVRVCV